MNFDDNEERQLLASSIARFVERDYTYADRAKIVASAEGYSDEAWKTFAELGLLGLSLPTEFGGFGGGAVESIAVMEAIGEALIVEPYLSCVGLCAQLIARGGTTEQKQRLLPPIVEGKLKIAFAQTETEARYNLAHIATRATKTGDGYVLDGEKRIVLHGPCADLLLVSARIEGDIDSAAGIGLFLIDAATPGLAQRGYRTLDELRASDATLKQVRVNSDALLGGAPAPVELIEGVADFATALICSEAVGAIRYANSATLEYLKTRKQFGVPIGDFQALQHRMVDMFIAYEQVKSMANLACASVDTEASPAARTRTVSAAKIKVADACRQVSQEAVQLHGGMGMSDEMKISHTFRRLTMIAQQFGDADHHLERFANA